MATRQTIPEKSAIFHATLKVPTAGPEELVSDVRDSLVGHEFEVAGQVIVLEKNVAVGSASLEELMAVRDGRQMREVMHADPPQVSEDAHQEVAAHLMAKSSGGCVVVVASDGSFKGVLSPQRMLAVLIEEHEEDLARLGGYTAGSRQARRAAEESVPRRLWHRLPWLLIGLLGAMLSAVILGGFEGRLEANVLIALFIPAIVYMADAVGTQTETLAIRALAVGVPIRDLVLKELVTGAVIGLVIGAAFFLFSLIGWGDSKVALAVGIALLASSTIATVVAMLLPALFQKLGIDPAFGSGPLATVAQDLLSILTYLGVVVLIAA
ncbi:MAG: magnesium transporter [Solirubrobacterales bacterium]